MTAPALVEGTRFAIRRGFWRPLLLAFTATRRRSFVEVGPDRVRFRFGFFDRTVHRGAVESAEASCWPWFGGIGWRLGLGGAVGLIGSLRGVVRVRLREPQRVWLAFIPVSARAIYVSLEDPEGFLRALDAQR